MNEKRFQLLEEKLSHIEMANAQLSDEIFRQQCEIDRLTRAHRQLLERIELLQEAADQQSAPQASGAVVEKPPHY